MPTFADAPVDRASTRRAKAAVATRAQDALTALRGNTTHSHVAIGVGTALVGACAVRFGFTPKMFLAAFVLTVLVVLSLIDVAERRLPNRIVLPSTAVVLVAQLAVEPERASEWLLAAVGAALFLLLPLFVYPAGMGMGDVKLALLIGAALGYDVVLALFVALLTSSLYAVVLLLRHGGAARKASMPFGPFLGFGAAVLLLLG